LLLSLSISITSYVNTNFFEQVLQNLIYGGLILEFTALIVSILLMSLAFAFAYGFLPNTRVKFGSAFIGGLVTTIIWKLMGSVFQGFFVASARESIYLAFATPIAVMFFIYIGWLVALIGSSIAFYHQHPAKARTGRGKLQLSISQQEQLNLAVATAIIQRFTAGGEPMNEDQLAATLASSPVAIESALQTLENIGLIVHTGEELSRFLPSKSVADSTMVDIWKAVRNYNEHQLYDAAESDAMRQVREFQASLDAAVEQQLGQRRLVSSSSSDTPTPPPADISKLNIKTGN
ncbi:MAG: YihY/virulence factor BrkB family protein, partial [Gammaproteobacteria bacterium]|nr:YihY/virulence factor BrkB family protein [Gammaproteobacteria bacterium]